MAESEENCKFGGSANNCKIASVSSKYTLYFCPKCTLYTVELHG